RWLAARVGVALADVVQRIAETLARVEPPNFDSEGVLVCSDVRRDQHFSGSGLPGVGLDLRMFAAVPLRDRDQQLLGVLCVFDRVTRGLSSAQRDGLTALARQVVVQLEARRNSARLERALQRLEVVSATDALTGLQNRRAFEQRIRQEFDRARRYHLSMSFLMLDVDYFKVYNDTHGHQAGDRVLHQVARTLQGRARGQDVLARFGGEEFAVILPSTGRNGALVLAERYRQAIEAMGLAGVTVSIGVATLDDTMQSTDELVGAADQALYLAKGAGRNKVVEAMRSEGAQQSANQSDEVNVRVHEVVQQPLQGFIHDRTEFPTSDAMRHTAHQATHRSPQQSAQRPPQQPPHDSADDK
ncbi:MAG: sensor domain-containing diguanylate cyclase, partial [Pseudomonadota bacterium]|nr:sensor domain-containing diguanylate cyclase [Pseudomonadota bacterium]